MTRKNKNQSGDWWASWLLLILIVTWLMASNTNVTRVFSSRTPLIQHEPVPPLAPALCPVSAQSRSWAWFSSLVTSTLCKHFILGKATIKRWLIVTDCPIHRAMRKNCKLWRQAESRTHLLWQLPHYLVYTLLSMPSPLHVNFSLWGPPWWRDWV